MKTRTVTMMGVLLCLGLHLEATRARAGAPPPKGVRLVGLLTEQFTQRCLPNYKVEWIDAHHEVGFVRLLLAPGVTLPSLVGRPVVVHGKPQVAYTPVKVEHTGTCPPMQMRMDFVVAKGGMRIKRGKAVLPKAFVVTRVEPFEGLTVTQKGKQVLVTVKNTLGVPLSGLTITAHYEGCRGKSGSESSAQQVPGLIRPGRQFQATLEPTMREEGASARSKPTLLLHSVQISATAPDLLFDFDVPLTFFPAIKVRCP